MSNSNTQRGPATQRRPATHHSPAQTLLRDTVHTVVEGKRPWGFVESTGAVSRSGWDRHRLIVFPPGITTSERRALTFVRRWPLWGAIAFLLIEIIFGSIWPSAAATIILIALYLTGIAVGLIRTRTLRKRVRQLTVSVVVLSGGTETFGDKGLYGRSVYALADLDRRLSTGELTPTQYEAGWSTVYDGLAQ